MPLRFTSPAVRSGSYRADIDGLRALAVIAVVTFHLNPRKLPGGFVGVDVFFVISGYLISFILVRDLEAGSFSFARFYERRMRRILPPLLVVFVTCIAAASVMLAPADLSRFGRSLVASSGFLSNLWFATHTTNEGYFGNPSAMQVLLHTWSLAVEEQFYLLFPVALWAAHTFTRRYRNTIFLAIFAASVLLSMHDVATRPVKAFYLIQDREWELLLGAMPVLIGWPEMQSRIWRELMAFAGLCMIVCAAFQFDEATPFPGFNALLPCGGALLLISSGNNGETLVKKLLSLRPVVFIGVLSYSIYLWHWPLLALLRYFKIDVSLTGPEQWSIVLLSVLLAFLSFEWIEVPIREKRVLRGRVPLLAAGVCASVCIGVAGWMLVVSHGLVRRYPEAIRETLWANQRRRDDLPAPDNCMSTPRPVRQFADVIFCTSGPPSQRILFWGDSHVDQFLPLLQELEANHVFGERGLVFAIEPGCPPSTSLKSKQAGYACEAIARYTLERAEQDDIGTVFFQFLPWWTAAVDRLCLTQDGKCVRTATPEEVAWRTGDDLFKIIVELKRRGKRVIIGLPFPAYEVSVPDSLLHKATFRSRAFSRQLREADYSLFRNIEEDVALRTGAEIFDPRRTLCPEGVCIYEHDGVSIYRDQSHFGASQTGLMKESFVQVLNRTLSPSGGHEETGATTAVKEP